MWFTETPWPPIIFLAAVGTLIGLVGISRQQAKLYAVAAVFFLLCGGVWFVEREIVTEAERIEQNIHEMVEAFHQNDAERTLSFISMSEPEWKAKVAVGIGLADIGPDYRITDYQATLKAENTLAETVFRVNADIDAVGHGDVGRQPTRWLVHWRLEGGEWKIIDVQRLRVVGPITETMPIFKRER